MNKALWIFPFKAIGKESVRDTKSMYSIAIQVISTFNKSELALLAYANDQVKPFNTLVITKKSLKPAELKQFNLSIKSWIDRGLLKRFKREHYIVNPCFFIPPIKEQEQVKDIWLSLP